jgi:hypothetical protein
MFWIMSHEQDIVCQTTGTGTIADMTDGEDSSCLNCDNVECHNINQTITIPNPDTLHLSRGSC